MRRSPSTLLHATAFLLLGCGPPSHGENRDLTAPRRTPPLPPGFTGAAGFEGVGQLTPLSDGFVASWDPVRDDAGVVSADYTYRVYVAFDGTAIDYGAPFVSSTPGASSVVIDGLATGTRISVAVQADSAISSADVDHNEVRLDGVV